MSTLGADGPLGITIVKPGVPRGGIAEPATPHLGFLECRSIRCSRLRVDESDCEQQESSEFEFHKRHFFEERFDFDFLDPCSFVRSTILLSFITYTGVPVLIPSSNAFRAARRRARDISSVSRECELPRRLINYLPLKSTSVPGLNYRTTTIDLPSSYKRLESYVNQNQSGGEQQRLRRCYHPGPLSS